MKKIRRELVELTEQMEAAEQEIRALDWQMEYTEEDLDTLEDLRSAARSLEGRIRLLQDKIQGAH